MIVREPIYVALYDKLKVVSNFKTTGRKAPTPNDVEASMCPCLFVVETVMVANPRPRGTPAKWTLEADVVVYVWDNASQSAPIGQETTVPATQLNNIIDAVEKALQPYPQYPGHADIGVQQLGIPEIIDHCWIEGRVETDEGLLAPLGMAVIPIKILAA